MLLSQRCMSGLRIPSNQQNTLLCEFDLVSVLISRTIPSPRANGQNRRIYLTFFSPWKVDDRDLIELTHIIDWIERKTYH